jgi:hypothetical protein
MKLTEAKRRGLAANILEAALFVGGGAFVGDNGQEMMNKVIPGVAIYRLIKSPMRSHSSMRQVSIRIKGVPP